MIRTTICALALTLSGSACGDDDADPIDCSTSTLTYDNFGSGFFADNCTTCHSETSTDRRFAPLAVNFDTLELVQNLSNRILARAGEGSSMPPSSAPATPSDGARELLAEWIQCGPN